MQQEAAEVFAGVADGVDFGVSGWIAAGNHAVPAFSNDFPAMDDHRTERPAFAADAAKVGEFKAAGKE